MWKRAYQRSFTKCKIGLADLAHWHVSMVGYIAYAGSCHGLLIKASRLEWKCWHVTDLIVGNAVKILSIIICMHIRFCIQIPWIHHTFCVVDCAGFAASLHFAFEPFLLDPHLLFLRLRLIGFVTTPEFEDSSEEWGMPIILTCYREWANIGSSDRYSRDHTKNI